MKEDLRGYKLLTVEILNSLLKQHKILLDLWSYKHNIMEYLKQ